MSGSMLSEKPVRQSQMRHDARLQGPVAPLDARSTAEQERAMYRLATIGEMTGGIAHDFRNLLGVIASSLRLAEGKVDEPDKVRAYIAAAREAIRRGGELTSQLLTFAKHQELEAHIGDLNEVLLTFAPFLRYGAGPNVRVKFELEPGIPDCLVDSALFDVAVLNLVVNARDAMPNGGEIRIVTDRSEQRTATSAMPALEACVRLRVVDSGHGMSEEILRRVFDSFFTTKGEMGTGIGLSQVRAYMQMVGGDIQITSSPGRGTTVELLFPSVHQNALPRS